MIGIAACAFVSLGVAVGYRRAIWGRGGELLGITLQLVCVACLLVLQDPVARLPAATIVGTLVGEGVAAVVAWRRRRSAAGS